VVAIQSLIAPTMTGSPWAHRPSRDYLDIAVGGAAALSTFLDEVIAACQMREALDTSHIFTK
jgi:hypothetical protein